jgi:hypothetical protein
MQKANTCIGFCGEYRIRTGDLLHAMQALYQLKIALNRRFLNDFCYFDTQT